MLCLPPRLLMACSGGKLLGRSSNGIYGKITQPNEAGHTVTLIPNPEDN